MTVFLSVGFILRTWQWRGLSKVKKQKQGRNKPQQVGGVSEKKFNPHSGSINASRVEGNLRQIPWVVGGVWKPLWMMVDSIWCVGVHCDLFPPSSTWTVPSLKVIFPLGYILYTLHFHPSRPLEMIHLKWFLVCSKHLIPRKISTHQRDFKEEWERKAVEEIHSERKSSQQITW